MSFGSNLGTGSSVASSSSRAARGVSSRIDRRDDDEARGSLDGVGGPGRWAGRALPPSAPDPLRTVPVRNSGGRRSLYTGPGSCAPVLRRDGGTGETGRSVGRGRSRCSSLVGFICSRCRGARRGARGARGVRQFTRYDGAIARATSVRDESNRTMARRDARGARSAPGGRRANPLIRARPQWLLTGWRGEVGRGSYRGRTALPWPPRASPRGIAPAW